MLPSLRSHEEYFDFVSENLMNIPIPEAHKDVVDKLKLLDLTPLRLLFIPLYCLSLGRIGFAPEDLFRCFIAMLLCGMTSPQPGGSGCPRRRAASADCISPLFSHPSRLFQSVLTPDFLSALLDYLANERVAENAHLFAQNLPICSHIISISLER